MRFLVKVTIPKEKGDEASKSGTLARTMQSAMQRLHPEAVYFFEEDGNRECLFVFNLDVPSLLKPLFPDLDASFYVAPVMNAAEFQQQGFGDEGGKQSVAHKSEILADLHPTASATPGSRSGVEGATSGTRPSNVRELDGD